MTQVEIQLENTFCCHCCVLSLFCLSVFLLPWRLQTALDSYSSCLEWIADNNLTIRRDVLEGMARCCTKLGQRDRALDLANSLVILL